MIVQILGRQVCLYCFATQHNTNSCGKRHPFSSHAKHLQLRKFFYLLRLMILLTKDNDLSGQNDESTRKANEQKDGKANKIRSS